MNDAPTLGDLIRARQETTGWSYRDLAERSPEGSGLNKTRWRELRMDEAKTFSGKQLRGVAVVLGASEQVVGRAALVTMGLSLVSDSGAIRTANAVHADPSLTERDRRIITAVLREMSAEERDGSGSAAPMKTAGGDPAGDQQDQKTPTASAAPVVGEQEGSSADAAGDRGAAGGEELTADFFYGLAADARRTEGMAQRDAIDGAGEESQVAHDEHGEA